MLKNAAKKGIYMIEEESLDTEQSREPPEHVKDLIKQIKAERDRDKTLISDIAKTLQVITICSKMLMFLNECGAEYSLIVEPDVFCGRDVDIRVVTDWQAPPNIFEIFEGIVNYAFGGITISRHDNGKMEIELHVSDFLVEIRDA